MDSEGERRLDDGYREEAGGVGAVGGRTDGRSSTGRGETADVREDNRDRDS